jgi:hypothetical protein
VRAHSDLRGADSGSILPLRVDRTQMTIVQAEPNDDVEFLVGKQLSNRGCRSKKQRELDAAERELRLAPDPEAAEALVDALPLLDVDWELVGDQDFRALLDVGPRADAS